MKLFNLVAVLAGTVAAVSALRFPHDGHRRDNNVTIFVDTFEILSTSTVYTTQIVTVTNCASEVTQCPDHSTVVMTSTIPLTTTPCLVYGGTFFIKLLGSKLFHDAKISCPFIVFGGLYIVSP
ncbi:hypothetical protein AOQ84DRAFT_220643 [Glonium stellatum]|uniref:Uncharacterized protein n=1 Tax=Glonium stellatum TaxID=574774 RepID=A0A8E2F327_9PEZI|nr:hypothetical protein AOQ84DRAFT_220643 [Glonium stellatum]